MTLAIQKMRKGELTNMRDPQIQASFRHAKMAQSKLNQLSIYSEEYRTIVRDLIPDIPDSSTIAPPFHCDHGHGIHLGKHVFINFDCTFLDGAEITIGDHTLIGPNVQLYTSQHPMGYLQRRESKEYLYPIIIGSDCWLGGSVVVCPGVTIGDRSIIGAGSVVTRDIPADCVAVGNPARVIKQNNDVK